MTCSTDIPARSQCLRQRPPQGPLPSGVASGLAGGWWAGAERRPPTFGNVRHITTAVRTLLPGVNQAGTEHRADRKREAGVTVRGRETGCMRLRDGFWIQYRRYCVSDIVLPACPAWSLI
jgi:hypothetical protein